MLPAKSEPRAASDFGAAADSDLHVVEQSQYSPAARSCSTAAERSRACGGGVNGGEGGGVGGGVNGEVCLG